MNRQIVKLIRTGVFSLVAASSLSAGSCMVTAWAEGFPGKGSSADWSDALPYYNRGNKYLSHARYEDAVNDYNEAISKYPYDPDFYTNLGVAYRKLEDFAHEEECFKKAVELNPKDWVPLNDLANAYLKQNKLKETIATYEKTLKLNPPAAQKAAILGDIKDITKILRMNGQLPADDGKKSAGNKRQVAAKSSGISAKSAVRSRTTDSGAPRTPEAGSVSSEKMKESGWDYVYKQ